MQQSAQLKRVILPASTKVSKCKIYWYIQIKWQQYKLDKYSPHVICYLILFEIDNNTRFFIRVLKNWFCKQEIKMIFKRLINEYERRNIDFVCVFVNFVLYLILDYGSM